MNAASVEAPWDPEDRLPSAAAVIRSGLLSQVDPKRIWEAVQHRWPGHRVPGLPVRCESIAKSSKARACSTTRENRRRKPSLPTYVRHGARKELE